MRSTKADPGKMNSKPIAFAVQVPVFTRAKVIRSAVKWHDDANGTNARINQVRKRKIYQAISSKKGIDAIKRTSLGDFHISRSIPAGNKSTTLFSASPFNHYIISSNSNLFIALWPTRTLFLTTAFSPQGLHELLQHQA